MSSSKMRVEIPENPKSLLDLAGEILTKHTAMGEDSPLNVIESNNWTIEGPKVSRCLQKHLEAERLHDEMEKAYKERDILLEGITTAVKATRDVLTGANHDNMKRLTEWGFNVIESPKPPSKAAK